MTIQAAIKSGKPFRRKVWGKKYPTEWYTTRKSNPTLCVWGFFGNWSANVKDILSTDWEIRA